MSNESVPSQAPARLHEPETRRPTGADDPDLARLIELVERIGGHGEQPL